MWRLVLRSVSGDAEIVDFRVLLEDGCVSGSRVDLNDPHLIVSGRVSGGFAGLSSESSDIRFAIGPYLIHTEQMDPGVFEFAVPVGHALPSEGETLKIGVAARFQWSSNGTSRTPLFTYLRCQFPEDSLLNGIDPICGEIADLDLIEDEGGEIIPSIRFAVMTSQTLRALKSGPIVLTIAPS